jgi:hypothetical protein
MRYLDSPGLRRNALFGQPTLGLLRIKKAIWNKYRGDLVRGHRTALTATALPPSHPLTPRRRRTSSAPANEQNLLSTATPISHSYGSLSRGTVRHLLGIRMRTVLLANKGCLYGTAVFEVLLRPSTILATLDASSTRIFVFFDLPHSRHLTKPVFINPPHFSLILPSTADAYFTAVRSQEGRPSRVALFRFLPETKSFCSRHAGL